MKDFIFKYSIDDSLYLNLTNRCTNNCTFCIRKTDHGVGYNLWLEREPSADEVINTLGDLAQFKEVVFCGYGEPLIRLDLLREVAVYLRKNYNGKIRINTNGHADLIHGRGSAEKLKGLVDTINISLNAHSSDKYVEICRPDFGPDSYNAVIQFIRDCREFISTVVMSVVEVPGLDIETCRELAKNLGVEFRLRKYLS